MQLRWFSLVILGGLLVASNGCAIYSSGDWKAKAQSGHLPLPAPVFESVQVSTEVSNSKVRAIIQRVIEEESGLVKPGAGTGYTLRVKATSIPKSLSIAIDVANALTVGMVPKIHDHTLKLRGTYYHKDNNREVIDASGEKLSKIMIDANALTSYRLWFPLIFYPPSWPFVNPDFGGDALEVIFEDLARRLCAELYTLRDTGIPPAVEGEPVVAVPVRPQVRLEPCQICGEPRGEQDPCPHCGMD